MEERVAELERKLNEARTTKASQKVEKFGNEPSDDWLVFKHHITPFAA